MKLKFLILGLIVAVSTSAWATLGGTADTVETDRLEMKAAAQATVKTTGSALYTVHEISSAGTIVREYISSRGSVFAVTWQGLTIPNLQSLFGDYYPEYSEGRKNQNRMRAPNTLKTTNLVVHHEGHMRALHGYAQIPLLVPAGVNVEKLP